GAAATISLNTGNANTWTALQQFNANASTTILSAYSAFIGGTATTTFTNAGFVGIASSTPGYRLSVAGSGFFDGGNVTASTITATSTGTFAGLLTASNGFTLSSGSLTLPSASVSDTALSS